MYLCFKTLKLKFHGINIQQSSDHVVWKTRISRFQEESVHFA